MQKVAIVNSEKINILIYQHFNHFMEINVKIKRADIPRKWECLLILRKNTIFLILYHIKSISKL